LETELLYSLKQQGYKTCHFTSGNNYGKVFIEVNNFRTLLTRQQILPTIDPIPPQT